MSAMRAQRLQRASPVFLRNVAVWFDMIGDTGSDDLAFAQAHRTKRLALKLTTRSAMPRGLVVQPAHSTKSPLLIASASLYYQLAAFRFGNATTQGHLEKFLSPSRCESDSLTARGNGRMEEAS